MFLLVPLFAAMIGLTVRRSGRNYPQQLYFALHVHADWFLILTAGTLARFIPLHWAPLSFAVPVWMLVYLVLHERPRAIHAGLAYRRLRVENGGQWFGLHMIALDSKSNIYTGEVLAGERVQRFLPVR